MTPLAQLSDAEFRQVQRIVYKAAGLAIAENGRVLLSSRVRKRLKILGLESFRIAANPLQLVLHGFPARFFRRLFVP